MFSLRLPAFLTLTTLLLLAGVAALSAQETLRPPVHPRRNVEDFAPVEARVIRFTILQTTRAEPCLDELEVYGPDHPERNLALADSGATVRASGTLPDFRIHALRHLNDGLYGNTHSWIGDQPAGWVEVELPQPARVNRIVWSRDRLGKFTDRLATRYRIEAARTPGQWELLASSDGRRPLEESAMAYPSFRAGDEGFAPRTGEAAGPAGAASREYVLETWRSEQGLPANSVTALLQAADGWLWVGTANGLARFDGLKFTTPGADALKGLRITCLHAARDGRLRAGTEGAGLFCQEDGVFTPVPSALAVPEQTILTLAEDAEGTLWAGTSGGLYSSRGGPFVRRAGGLVSRIVPDPSGRGLWLIRERRLERWTGTALESPGPAEEPARFGSLIALAPDDTGAVWFGGANEYFARLDDGTVSTFAEGHALFTTALREILPVPGGDVWLGTAGSGLARMHDGALLTFGPDDGLPSNSIAALCQDSGGNLWAGGGDGLTRVSPRRCAAVTVNDGLSHGVVMSLAEDASGTVWLGTNGGGINCWDGTRAAPFAPSYVLDNEVIPAILADRNGVVWAGTVQSGLARMEGGAVRFLTTAQGLPENAVTALCEDDAGGIWAGSPAGGAAYVTDDTVTRPAALAPLTGGRITAIITDARQRVWFGTGGQGIALLDSGVLTRFTTADGLAGNAVRTLRLDDAGTLWAGTSAGLSRWREGKFESFTTRDGLPDDMISQILDDGDGHLWLGTSRGVARVSLESLEAVSTGRASRLEVLLLARSDGLPALECTGGYHPAGVRLHDGRLCFGTVAGLAVIRPSQFSPPAAPPPVFIEAGQAADGRERSAAFAFTALAYSAPQRLRFRYRLEGLENGWTEAGPERRATYEFLPPGDFRFHVQASLDGGPWGAAGTGLHVPAPWWRSPWVIGAGIFVTTAGVAGVARFFARRRLKQRLHVVEQKLALERERTRIARDIHDQLGANLTHIALLSAGAHESLPAPTRERFLAIAASSHELVQAVDAIVWAVNPRHGSLESLARYLTRFADDFLAPAPLRLRLDVPMELPAAELSPEVRHSLFLAAREVLNNCVRHADATEVQLRLNVSGSLLTIVISDNGRGFVPPGTGEGDGLENMRRRLTECGGACEIASAPGRGTTVTFTLPLAVPP